MRDLRLHRAKSSLIRRGNISSGTRHRIMDRTDRAVFSSDHFHFQLHGSGQGRGAPEPRYLGIGLKGNLLRHQ